VTARGSGSNRIDYASFSIASAAHCIARESLVDLFDASGKLNLDCSPRRVIRGSGRRTHTLPTLLSS